MKHVDGFVVREIAGKRVAVAIGDRVRTFNGMISLGNETAYLLWSALDTDQTEESLVALLTERYDVSEEQASGDVHRFVEQLREAGLLDES
ncbi:MAG: PqqD family protein [Clostridia bacterium]|nr:PqqD family protein [Clostridia bacterium]